MPLRLHWEGAFKKKYLNYLNTTGKHEFSSATVSGAGGAVPVSIMPLPDYPNCKDQMANYYKFCHEYWAIAPSKPYHFPYNIME